MTDNEKKYKAYEFDSLNSNKHKNEEKRAFEYRKKLNTKMECNRIIWFLFQCQKRNFSRRMFSFNNHIKIITTTSCKAIRLSNTRLVSNCVLPHFVFCIKLFDHKPNGLEWNSLAFITFYELSDFWWIVMKLRKTHSCYGDTTADIQNLCPKEISSFQRYSKRCVKLNSNNLFCILFVC